MANVDDSIVNSLSGKSFDSHKLFMFDVHFRSSLEYSFNMIDFENIEL